MASSITRIFLVRHGATILTAEDRFAGSIDVPLADVGREQARRLAERLRTERIAAVYASPLGRAVETASIVAAPHGLEVTTDAALREISHGRWEEMTRQEVEARFADEAAAWDADPYTFAPLGGETGLDVTARALPAVLDLVRRHAGETILVVSHKATIRLLLSSLLGFDPRRYRDNLDQSPAALNIVDFRGPTRARLTLFNDTSHYDLTPDTPRARLSPAWCRQDEGPDGTPWEVWRQDDNGNRALVRTLATRAEAEAHLRDFESRHHKQTYWISPAPDEPPTSSS